MKLDGLVFEDLAAAASPDELDAAVGDFLDIGDFVDGGLKQQAALDNASLQRATGRVLSPAERARFEEVQLQAMRWTFLGSGLVNEGFLTALGAVTPEGRTRIEQAAPAFC